MTTGNATSGTASPDVVDSAPDVEDSVLRRAFTRLWSWRIGAALFLGYLLLSVWLWHSMIGHLTTRAQGGGQGDAGLFMWWLGWAAHAVTHGLNPLQTDFLQAPQGISGVWNTSVLALGIPMTPVTLMFGTAASFNVLLILSPALTCTTTAKWLRRHVGTVPAAVAALLFGFSPFVLTHIGAHLHLVFLALIPVILMLVEDLLVRAERPLWPTAPLLGLTIAVQYFIGSEVLLMLALTLVPAILLLAVVRRDLLRARIRKVLVAGPVALVVAVLLLAYGLSEQFSAAHRFLVPIFAASGFLASWKDLVHATPVLHFSGRPPAGLGVGENGTYIGWPLGLLLMAVLVLLRRNLLVVVAAAVAVVAVICEVGPQIDRSSGRPIKLSPLAVAQHFLPLTGDILPARFAVIFFLATSVILAFGLAEAIRLLRQTRWQGLTALGLSAVALLSMFPGPAPALGNVPVVPAFFTDGALQQSVPQGATVMVAPMATVTNVDAEYWQSTAGMWFRQLGGYALNNSGSGYPSFFPQQRTLVELFQLDRRGRAYGGPLTAAILTTARTELQSSGATFFLVGPSAHAQVGQLALAGRLLARGPDLTSGGVAIWVLTGNCSADVTIGPLCPR